MSTHILLACPEMEDLAEGICAAEPRIERGGLGWKEFPDTWPNLYVPNYDSVRSAHVSFLASITTPHDLFAQYAMIRKLAGMRPRSLKIFLSYFATGTMEREEADGDVATAAALAGLLGKLPPSGPGPIPFYLIDPHTLDCKWWFGDNVAVTIKSGTTLHRARMQGGNMNYTVAFPDGGAYMRFKKMYDGSHGEKYDIIVCDKVRRGDERIITIKEGDPEGKDISLVDDIAHTAGTLIQAKHALMKAGAKSVGLYVSHPVMENNAHLRILGAGFSHVWYTDSCPGTVKRVHGLPGFECLSLAPKYARYILDV